MRSLLILVVAALCAGCFVGHPVSSPSAAPGGVAIGSGVILAIIDDAHELVDAHPPQIDTTEMLAQLDEGDIVSSVDGGQATILWLLRSCEKAPTMVLTPNGAAVNVTVYRGPSEGGVSTDPAYVTDCGNAGHARGVTLTFSKPPTSLLLRIQDGSPA